MFAYQATFIKIPPPDPNTEKDESISNVWSEKALLPEVISLLHNPQMLHASQSIWRLCTLLILLNVMLFLLLFIIVQAFAEPLTFRKNSVNLQLTSDSAPKASLKSLHTSD